jgi:formate hydrogenlyase transcriptional activator
MTNRGQAQLEANRYRILVGVSSALASQPDIHAVLHSVAALLSKVVRFDSVTLLLTKEQDGVAQVYALERGAEDPAIEIGTEVPFEGTAIATAMGEQQPIFVPDTKTEILKIPALAQYASLKGVKCAYIFPFSSTRRKLGVLIFGATGHEQYGAEDIELMSLVAKHVSVALESALALKVAERYRSELERERQELETERDRLKLLLQINNHTVTHLDVNELLRAASVSIRKFFKNAFTGFWLFAQGTSQLQCISLDFPGSSGFIENIQSPSLSESELEGMRTRAPKIWGHKEIEELPSFLSQPLRAESIISLVSVPLVGATNLLGMISLGNRRKDAFSQLDFDLLSQIANQISLALESALAYGRLNVSRNRLEDERHYLESEIRSQYNFEDIVGNSPTLKKVLDQVAIVAQTDATVLLIGETGTGKELIARAIHNLSPRRDRTFVRLNCAAIPQGLMESELFGHEKGAFTGALVQKRGRVELAHEGSLFLDEVGDINPELQPKLLRVLQEKEFERLGSNRTVKVDVRLIAATHRDLPAMVQNGEFREDLYYRLNVFPIYIPPLRDRKEDIPQLVHYFVASLSHKMRKSIRIIPRNVMEKMISWHWPGNVRELQNFVERSVILTRDETLAAPISELSLRVPPLRSSSATLDAAERAIILQALRDTGGKVSGTGGAAERLGLKRTTLQGKMLRLGIRRLEYS